MRLPKQAFTAILSGSSNVLQRNLVCLSFPLACVGLAGVCLRPSILLGGWYLEAGEANISYQQIAAADGVWAEDK